jgi:hypothetical protein
MRTRIGLISSTATSTDGPSTSFATPASGQGLPAYSTRPSPSHHRAVTVRYGCTTLKGRDVAAVWYPSSRRRRIS